MLLLLLACQKNETIKETQTSCSIDSILQEHGYTGLSAEVRVRNDQYGIPHIDATTTADAFYASGYLQARDRLFQLEMMRRRVRGSRAEVLGESYLSDDKQALAFGFARYGCESLEATAAANPDHMKWGLAWVAGVNDWIVRVNTDPSLLPPEFVQYDFSPQPYAPEDFIAVGTAILLGFSNTLEYDLLYTLIARTVPDYTSMPVLKAGVNRFIMTENPPSGPTTPARTQPPLDIATVANSRIFEDLKTMRGLSMGPGSNNWVVEGSVTSNGMPFLANDTHSGLGWPNTMWMGHLRSPDFDAAGFGFVGAPGIQLGHNRHLSWGSTTNWADVVDVWDVVVTGNTLEFAGQTIPLETETHTIRIKQDDGSIREETLEIQLADGYGIIVGEELLGLPPGLLTQNALLASWVGFAPNDDLGVFLGFDTATDLDDFVASVDQQDVGLMNWVGATQDGIRYHAHGKVPDRMPGIQANQILDGSDPATQWTAYLDPENLPSLQGDRAYIATANNDPWGHTLDNDPTNDDFYYGSFYDPGWRADRISKVLDEKIAAGLVDFDDMVELQLDTYSEVADRWLPLLSESVAKIGTDSELSEYEGVAGLTEAVALLGAWDRHLRRDSEAAALFRVWVVYVTRKTLGDEVGLVYDSVEEGKPPYLEKIALLAHEEKNEGVLDSGADKIRVGALVDALAWIVASGGGGTVTWGDIHKSVFTTPDGVEQLVPTDGGNDTINSSECTMWGDGDVAEICRGESGPILRQITQFRSDGTPELYFNAPLSNDGDLERWVEGEYVLLPFEDADIDAVTVSEEVLTP